MYGIKTNGNQIPDIDRKISTKSVLVVISALWILLMLIIGIAAPYISAFDYQELELSKRLLPPAWMDGGDAAHFLGTDDLGRDVLSRLYFSIRMSLLVAIIGTVLCAILGTTLGFIAAHFRGVVDDIIMMFVDFQASLPFMILALAVIAFFENSLILFIGIMSIFGWERYTRFSRGLALTAEEHGYAVAIRSLGASPARVYFIHILPNVANTLLVNMTMNFPKVIMMETGLSFLGLGIQPPNTSLGNMVSFGRDYLLSAWWLTMIPTVVIFLTTLSMSLLGDWVRDKLDPVLS